MKLLIPDLCMVVLIGPSGAGKSTFARMHFKPTEILSSDALRGLLSDDETDQSASADAFEILHLLLQKRLRRGRLCVIDATNVQADSRKTLIQYARQFNVAAIAVVFDINEQVCLDRNRLRPDRRFGPHVVRRHVQQLRHSLGRLRDEGFRHVHTFTTPDASANTIVERTPLLVNRRYDSGPFDIIGDVHGCALELRALLEKLGYHFTDIIDVDGQPGHQITPPLGRKATFLGDLVDRGPDSAGVLRIVMHLVEAGNGWCVPGNHDAKLLKKLQGRDVNIGHGLALTLEQLDREPLAFRERVRRFIDGLPSHLLLDDGKLVVAHAGMKEELQGRMSGRVRDFALYGETTGETDEFGLPVRLNWSAQYRGTAAVVYGHTPVAKPEWLNNTICLDTGCVYGAALSALRYPEQEIVSVPALQKYCEAKRPFLPPIDADQSNSVLPSVEVSDYLDLGEVLGRRMIPTRLIGNVTIREGQSAAALEVMSRFAVDPRWLIYLPPTMSPCETSQDANFLEHPAEALAYFRQEGLTQVIAQRKHMGSRAVVIIGRDPAAIQRTFGVSEEGLGICLTRTGRRFFTDPALEIALLQRLHEALTHADFWGRYSSDWFCFDGELMPWSAKAQQLLVSQYAPVAASGASSFSELESLFSHMPSPAEPLAELMQRYHTKAECLTQFRAAYRRYCWNVQSVDDLQFAPFHLLASEGKVHVEQDHAFHMRILTELAGDDRGVIRATPHRLVELGNAESEAALVQWWLELTEAGGEGIVIKPLPWVHRGPRGLTQPAIKVRGREYLRIIYGPEYTMPENLTRLKSRGLGVKRSLAVREYALGIQALERFVQREPLRRIHECVFAILALESEPIDPRL